MKRTALSLLFSAILLSPWALTLRAERWPILPRPFATPSTEHAPNLIPWPEWKRPIAPAGWHVSEFAKLKSPRSLYLLPSGDVLVSQASNPGNSPNRITLLKLRGSTLNGTEVFAEGLNLPFGMAMWKNEFFVAEPDRVLKFKVRNGRLIGTGKTIATLPYPKPRQHWTRHLLLSPDGAKLYVSVGSASNVGEAPDTLDKRTAAILEMNRDGSQESVYASGLRNPVSMAWEPSKGELWTVVNERDGMGDDLPPDYITAVRPNGFYGWPYAYWGAHPDPRFPRRRSELISKSIMPDYSIGPHVAGLGITFTKGMGLPAPYAEGALVTEHGSWNRSKFSGYKVAFVPFKDGNTSGNEIDFLTGFIASESEGTVYGRPVASVILKDGSVLVSDDGSNRIWKVSPSE